jgi:hypothetical protein
MITVIRGPYCTGAVTPSGASPQVLAPQAQRREISWCSVPAPSSGASQTPAAAPHPPRARRPDRRRSQHTDRAHTATAHSDRRPTPTSTPGYPRCPPGLRPLLRRNDCGAGLTNGESADGGFDELRLFAPTAASTPQPRPAAPRPSPAAPRSPRQAPHRTDDQQAPHHDRKPRPEIN